MKIFIQNFNDYYYSEYFTLLALCGGFLVLTIAVFLSCTGSAPAMINLYEGIQSIF